MSILTQGSNTSIFGLLVIANIFMLLTCKGILERDKNMPGEVNEEKQAVLDMLKNSSEALRYSYTNAMAFQ